MDLKTKDLFRLCRTPCFVRVERMDEKQLLQYLDKYCLKITSPLNFLRKTSSESKSLAGTNLLEKDKKSNSKKQKRKECKDVEFEEERNHGRKRKLETDSRSSKPKKKKREPEIGKNVKLDLYRENDKNWSNYSEKTFQNKIFKNRCERNFKESGSEKVVKVSWSLFKGFRNRKTSTNEKGRTNKFKRKKTKHGKPKKTGEFVEKCKKSTMSSGYLISSDKVKTISDNLDAEGLSKNMRNDGAVNQSESCSENNKENVVVQDLVVKNVDVERNVQCNEGDYDSREDSSEDDKRTVIFEGNKAEKEKEKTILKAESQEIKSNVASNLEPGKQKKRKRGKAKRKKKKKQFQEGIKIFGVGWKNKKNSRFTEKVLSDVSILLRRLNEKQRFISQLTNLMPTNGDIASYFKTVVLPKQKNFQKDIRKNFKTIMTCYDDLMKVYKNPLDVTLEISKRTLLNVEDVHKIISQCLIVKNTSKFLKESKERPIKPTFLMQGDGKSRDQFTKFPTECSEKTGFGGPEHLKSHSNAAGTKNFGTQISWLPPLKYFLTENPSFHPDCTQKAGMNMSAAMVRWDPRLNCGQPANFIPGIGPSIRGPHTGTQQHSAQTNVYLYSTEATGNYPQIACQQQNNPRGGNPPVQTQSVGSPADFCYVYNVVPGSYPVTREKIFFNQTPYTGGVLYNIPAPYVHPRANLASVASSDPKTALSILGSRDPRTALTSVGLKDPRVALPIFGSKGPRVALSNPGCRDPRIVGKKQPAHTNVPPQITIYNRPQSNENLTSAQVVTNPPGKNLRKVTSLPVVLPTSVHTNNLKWQAIPNTASNLLKVPLSQPGSKSALPPKKNDSIRAVLTEKPAFENKAQSISVRYLPKEVPVNVNPVLSQSQYQLMEITNPCKRGTGSPSSNHALGRGEAVEEVLDPTTPQKLIMKGRRLQAGAVLTNEGEKAKREGGKKDVTKVTVTKGTDPQNRTSIPNVKNQRTYACALDGCENPGFKVCRMCLSVIYCSGTCQWNHWTIKHKGECYKLKELRR